MNSAAVLYWLLFTAYCSTKDMIKDILSIKGEKVVHFDTGDTLAFLNFPIFNPDTGVIEAFWVKPLTVAMKDGIILTADILAFKKKVYIKSDKVICNPAEVLRIASILDEARPFLYAVAQNEKGKRYGRVYNLSFSTETYVLRILYTQKTLLGLFAYDQRVFPYERVLRVLPKIVIIDDEGAKKEKVVEAPAEPA